MLLQPSAPALSRLARVLTAGDAQGGMFAIRDERDYVIQEDLMRAVRKMNVAKKLETNLSYDSAFGDGNKGK